jgi:glycosyltransferase involved in cell wall biosynthesis
MSAPGAVKVSIVIPVRNGARFLPEALEDVRRQTHSEHETIVVDGRSTDGSAAIARCAGARVIEQPGDGFADAWNLGVAAAGGEALAFLDSDDRWDPEKLAAQLEVLRSRPEVDYVITRMQFFIEPGVPYPPGFRPHLLEGDHVANMPSALLIRRSAFDRVGPFRTDMRVANDIEWFARVKDAGLTRAIVPRVLVRKRVHDANWSHSHPKALHGELTGLLRETVARQRAAP